MEDFALGVVQRNLNDINSIYTSNSENLIRHIYSSIPPRNEKQGWAYINYGNYLYSAEVRFFNTYSAIFQ